MSAAQDDPWAVDHDLAGRIQLALSILGHADEKCWPRQVGRAVLALRGQSIEQIAEAAANGQQAHR